MKLTGKKMSQGGATTLPARTSVTHQKEKIWCLNGESRDVLPVVGNMMNFPGISRYQDLGVMAASKSAIQLIKPVSRAEGTGLGVSEYKKMSMAYLQHEKQRQKQQRDRPSKSPILQSRTADA